MRSPNLEARECENFVNLSGHSAHYQATGAAQRLWLQPCLRLKDASASGRGGRTFARRAHQKSHRSSNGIHDLLSNRVRER